MEILIGTIPVESSDEIFIILKRHNMELEMTEHRWKTPLLTGHRWKTPLSTEHRWSFRRSHIIKHFPESFLGLALQDTTAKEIIIDIILLLYHQP